MKRFGKVFLISSVFCIILVLFAGCSTKNSDSDHDFGDSYDAEYLMNDYAEQLVRDGAETVVGTIEIAESGENYTVTVDEKKVVVNDNYEDGYYIADKNLTNSYPLGSDLGIVAIEDGSPVVCTADDFIKNHSGDTETLYTVYLIGDGVEQILPLDPQTVLNQAN